MKIKIILTGIICLLTANLFAQSLGYTISGNIKDLPDGITFYLILNKDGGDADTIDRIKSKDQKFTFKGSSIEEGRLVFVKMDTSILKIASDKLEGNSKRKQSWVRLMLDNSGSVIQLKGEVKDWPVIEIEGSKLTQEHDEFISKMSIVRGQYNEIVEKLDVRQDSLGLAQARKVYDLAFLKNLEGISNSYAIPYFLQANKRLDLDLKDAAYQKMSDRLKNSYYGKLLKQEIIGLRIIKTIGLGKIIPDFEVKSPEGKIESVRALAKQSKYTLVDFWAYWCKPCRADIPDMKKVYSAFHDKGFNILSVSTDPNDLQWQKALKEENTPWINGMQVGRPSVDIFGLSAIPAYILLNEKAEIIQMDLHSSFIPRSSIGSLNGMQVFANDSKARRLRGDDLYQVIEELLGKSN